MPGSPLAGGSASSNTGSAHLAKVAPAYRPMVLTEREPRDTSQPLGSLADPAIASWLGAYADTASGVWVTADSARQCPEVDACVGLIEDTVATVPCELFRRTDNGGRERAGDNPLYGLMHDRPNGWQSSSDFFKMMEGWRQTHGHARARLITSTRGPVGLEPMYPPSCRPYMTPRGLVYRWTPPDGGPVVTLLPSEVLDVRGGPPRPGRIFESVGKVELHRDDIGLVMACSQYLSRFFSNNAVPKAYMEVPGEINDVSAGLLRERYERRHRGLENQHRIGILDGGAKLTAIGSTNDDAQVIETHSMGVAKLARSWGVPAFLIGETGGVSNFGTGIEQQSIGFVTYYMRPKFVAWEQALDVLLMSDAMRRQYFFEFNIDGLLRGDFKTRMDGYAIQIQWGICSVNEIRRLMNLAPVAGGDERLIPLNMCPASMIKDVLLKPSAGGGAPDPNANTRELVALIAAANGIELPERLNGH